MPKPAGLANPDFADEENSFDSRFRGFVERKQIVGKGRARKWMLAS
jgi:hypothetical protein